MRRNLWIIGLAACSLAGLARAENGAAPAPGTSETKPPAQSAFTANRINGRIKSVDQSSHRLKIDEKGTDQDLKFSDSATVFIDGRLGSIDDLREGQEVRAAYEERDGQKNLRWLDVATEPSKPGTPQNEQQQTPTPQNQPSTPQPAPR